MTYERFEDLPVWKDAVQFATDVFQLTDDKTFRFKGDITNQLQRAALSISNNIAEGFERGTTPELLTFLYIARGSAGESRSILCVCERLPFFDHLKATISDLKKRGESISRQLRAWADSLQNSDIKGQRYLTDQTREKAAQQKRADEFMQKLKTMTPHLHHPPSQI
jgi:four helix bundle protein